ncbi:hypothetical protein [Thiocapsa bogorovii]|uniref:hypothetical protein n=1 Tax=Thiocapsa bogorovii TaxID=521689 RepID=UPI001E37C14B|nr:hypothetical protein [Thiocapsa bogorovii]UHD14506.1 hypothetical protein LT988_14480 [Thiocapsa bogorovii]
MTRVRDFPRLLAEVLPADWRAVLAFYFGYAISALALIVSLYLFLPILRNTNAAVTPLIDYELSLVSVTFRFSLSWWVPFGLVVLSAVLLAMSKRLEYRIWSFAYNEFWQRYRRVFAVGAGKTIRPRRLERAARARAMALRWLALLGLDLLKAIALLSLLLMLEPRVLPVVMVVLCVLMIVFYGAIWGEEAEAKADLEPGARNLEDLVRHRVRLVNARQVLFALMPITILSMLLLSRLGVGIRLDLAGLLFLSFLISALGNTLGDAVQTLIRVQQLDESLLASWGPLSRGEQAAFVDALGRGPIAATNDDCDDD